MKRTEYQAFFDESLKKVKTIRDPHANDFADDELLWGKVLEHSIFNFDNDFIEYNKLIIGIRNVTIECLTKIISLLNIQYRCGFEPIVLKDTEKKDFLHNVVLTINDTKNKTLLFIKDIEEGKFWKTPKENDFVISILNKYGANECKYIYLMDDCAYLQIIGHNSDINDPGRGNNCYGLKYLFDTYYVDEEFEIFNSLLKKYISDIKEYIGYTCVKNLNPHALINFKYLTYNSLKSYDYGKLCNDTIIQKKGKNAGKACVFQKKDFLNIQNQFESDVTTKICMSKLDFVESLLTSEWLCNSLIDCKAIDLTSIGSGYFKAGEQLLYSIICLHKDEHRNIKRLKSKEPGELTKTNIEKKEYLDFSLGAMANFFKDNRDLFKKDIFSSCDYICETLFEYANLRNGYFHKDNIHDISIINNIKDKTYKLFFIMLGAIDFREKDYDEFNLPLMDYYDDYYRLCEFVNFHNNTYFFIQHRDKEFVVKSIPDINTRITNNHVEYSGAYFVSVDESKHIIKFDRKHLPEIVYYGKLHIIESEEIKFEIRKICKIFENDKFIGPSIIEDKNFSY